MKYPPEIISFINDNKNLFWYTPEEKKEEISIDFLVETVLNYGTLKDFRKLVSIFGIDKTAQVFTDSISKSGRRRGNYHELTLNFFSLVFKRYAS